jgi:hypothetical protein
LWRVATKKKPAKARPTKPQPAKLEPRPARRAIAALQPFVQRELRLDLPQLGPSNPGLAWIDRDSEIHSDTDGTPMTVIGGNLAGLWFVLAKDGSIELVDDAEHERGTTVFASVAALAEEFARQNS